MDEETIQTREGQEDVGKVDIPKLGQYQAQ